jgi:5'-nucleotidase
VFKADANARTVYVHELRYDTATRKLQIDSRLQRITSDLADEPEVLAAVNRWVDAAFDGFRAQGFDPKRVVATTTEELDGREASVRNFPTSSPTCSPRACFTPLRGPSWRSSTAAPSASTT